MDRHHDAAELLLSARRDPTQRLNSLPEAIRPRTAEQAYLDPARGHGPTRRDRRLEGRRPRAPPPTTSPARPCRLRDRLRARPSSPAGTAASRPRSPSASPATCRRATSPIPSETSWPRSRQPTPPSRCCDSRYVNPDAVDPLSNLADSLVPLQPRARPGDPGLAVASTSPKKRSASWSTGPRSSAASPTRPAT